MDKLISAQAAIDALRYAQHRFTVADEAGGIGTVKWSEDVIYFAAAERVLTELPSAQPDSKDLVEKIKNGITASDGNNEYFIGLRNGMRWCLSLIDDKEPIYESSAQPDHIGDVNGKVSFTEKERGILKKMRTLHNGTYADLLDRLVASAQGDADSAYIEGHTYAESKYRKMWDEMPKIVYCRECMHREYCFSDVAMTNRSQTSTIYESIEYCSYGERRNDETN